MSSMLERTSVKGQRAQPPRLKVKLLTPRHVERDRHELRRSALPTASDGERPPLPTRQAAAPSLQPLLQPLLQLQPAPPPAPFPAHSPPPPQDLWTARPAWWVLTVGLAGTVPEAVAAGWKTPPPPRHCSAGASSDFASAACSRHTRRSRSLDLLCRSPTRATARTSFHPIPFPLDELCQLSVFRAWVLKKRTSHRGAEG